MLIVSQDREYQTENLEIVISPEMNESGETGRYEILSHSEYCLGVYGSLSKAKQVMCDLRRDYIVGVSVFNMPKIF